MPHRLSRRPPRLYGVVTPFVLLFLGPIGGLAATHDAARPTAGSRAAGASAAAPTTVTLPLDAAAYYWREQSKSVPVAGVAPPSAPDGSVPAGDLAVAAIDDTSGQPDKETYLRLDTSSLVGGTPTSVQLVVPLDTSSAAGNVYDTTSPPSVTACAVAGAFSENTGAVSYENKPKDDCSAKSVGTFDAAHATWSFDITSLAARWVSVGINSGVALMPTDPAATPPFQYVFGPRPAIHATARLEPLPAQLDDLSAAPVTGPGSAAPPQATPIVPSGPSQTTTSAAVAQAPTLAPRPTTMQRTASAAYTSRTEWQLPALGMLGAVALLACCSLVTGARRRRSPRII